MPIPRISARDLLDPARPGHAAAREALRLGAEQTGFLTLHDTPITPSRVLQVLAAYRAFFRLPDAQKTLIDMARTGANRGWGAPGGEQVDPDANPDYKQVFDCGFELAAGDPLAARNLSVYAPNQWPRNPPEFAPLVRSYYAQATGFALDLLRALAGVVGQDPDYFADRFDRPMALLRGNYYPVRPDWATERDFGIAAHTDYGCLTLLATDGRAGLEVRSLAGDWVPVTAEPGCFIVNFGEMFEIWTAGRVRATPHRVIGGPEERISVPLFFNPNYDTDISPPGSATPITAGSHLARRFDETYLHMKSGMAGA